MRLRKNNKAGEVLRKSRYVIDNPGEYKGKWHEVFDNANDIHIEIGMGKGKFIIENAIKYPNINFIGIEKYDTVLMLALKKLNNLELSNLKIICIDAKELESVFDHEIAQIYLNFSDPWPKNRHHKRRLTSHDYLKVYDNVFKNDNVIVQKTDNQVLFGYSIESLSTYGYTLKNVSLDLHNSKYKEDNITTEYEEKFIQRGQPIFCLTATMTNRE